MKPDDSATTSGGFSGAHQGPIGLDVLSRIRSVSVRVDVVPDVADPVSKMPIQVNESEVESLRQSAPIVLLPPHQGRLVESSVDRAIVRPKRRNVEIRNDKILVQSPRRLRYGSVQIDNPRRPIRNQVIGTTRDVSSNDVNTVPYRRAISTLLASGATSTLFGGSPLFVGMNTTLRPERPSFLPALRSWSRCK